MEAQLKKLIFPFLIFTLSLSSFADCIPHFKQRATFKAERYRGDPNPYNKHKADRAQDEAETLEKLVMRKTDKDLDQKVWMVCTNFFIDPDMPNGEYNSDRYCPLGKMFTLHAKFLEFVKGRNATDGYCKPKDIGFLRKALRGDKNYEPRDYIFNLNTEFAVYLGRDFLSKER